MIEVKYLLETICILEESVSPEKILNGDDYLMIAMRILKCDASLEEREPAKKISDAKIDLNWYAELTDFFYDKMLRDVGDEDE